MGEKKTGKTPELSIVIPAYNEERVIGETIDEVWAYLEGRGLPSEIIVISDGSTDRTAQIAHERAARHPEVIKVMENELNMGKGFSVRKGCLAANGAVVAFTDADLSYPIS